MDLAQYVYINVSRELQRSLATGLVGKNKHEQAGRDEQAARHVDRDRGVEAGGDRNDGRYILAADTDDSNTWVYVDLEPPSLTHNTENPVRRSGQGVARPSILRREDLGRVSIQHGVHERRAKVVGAIPAEQGVAGLRGSAGIDEDAREHRR